MGGTLRRSSLPGIGEIAEALREDGNASLRLRSSRIGSAGSPIPGDGDAATVGTSNTRTGR
jgi:hypothetical protein